MNKIICNVNMDTNKYNTSGKRIIAFVIDLVILQLFEFIEITFFSPLNNELTEMLIIFCFTLFYFIFSNYKFGQTFGKKIVGIKVLSLDEQSFPTLKQSFLRQSIYIIIDLFEIVYILYFYNFTDMNLEMILENEIKFLTYLLVPYLVIEILLMVFNKKGRTIHDYIAKTVVINDRFY